MSPENMISLLTGVLPSGLISVVAFFMIWRRKFDQLVEQRKTEAFYLDRVTKLLEKAVLSKKEDAHARIFALALSEQTDRLITGAVSDKKKALRIAEWIGTRWRNVSAIESVSESHDGPDRYLNFLHRTGACGIRSTLFVHMAVLAGLKARRFSIVNLAKVGDGHATVQVFWDGGWHFFDVTNSGYFERDGHILSFEEMRAERESKVQAHWNCHHSNEPLPPRDNHIRARTETVE